MRAQKIFVTASAVIVGATFLVLAALFGWMYLTGAHSQCAGEATRLLERATKAKVSADEAANRAKTDKSEEAQESARQAAQQAAEAIANARRFLDLTKARAEAEHRVYIEKSEAADAALRKATAELAGVRGNSFWSSCRG